MADDKSGREAQARSAERRQREREIAAALERGGEAEPPIDAAELVDFEVALESLSYPATGAEIVTAVGDHEIDAADRTYTVGELLPKADVETFDSPADVRVRVQRPTIAATMKRIVEAVDALPNEEFGGSQRDAYEKTLDELESIDEDDDEGVRVIGDWIVERIRDDETLPGSRAVRRRAAKFCQESGYRVRNDEWLGV
ncbi:DUF5789 family protein [Haloplanus natans]|uniref:DUF5789 family protein n=1 Tax=Haloplanus natans TaxID=376171 RepID=UPI000677C501|nr:hypothetical protein [Haloplanus natans]